MIKTETSICEPSSFRDRSGFVFTQEGRVYRQVNIIYRENYDYLISSGLYEDLVRKELLVPHTEIEGMDFLESGGYKIIRPEQVPLITYPYEWCFSQYRDAALLTLEIQKIALEYGMTLKDASVYNVQFLRGRPVFIDSLSFEIYEEGKPWVAYSQFCQHFLAPIALMQYKDVRLAQLMRTFMDGVPLDLAASLLPRKTLLQFGLLMHIHLHAKSKKRFSSSSAALKSKFHGISKNALFGLFASLRSTIEKFKWIYTDTEWAGYYGNTNYTDESFFQKAVLLKDFMEEIKPSLVWDLGANTGFFSRIVAECGASVVSFDIDPNAIERNYAQVKAERDKNILPLFLDINSPSPAIGWANEERVSLAQRSKADVVVALALIHHLAISNNVPLDRIARYFASLAPNLVIEFVPKEDSQVQKLLASREDVFENYNFEGFEDAISGYYEIVECRLIEGSLRKLYWMRRHEGFLWRDDI